ncbi:ABC transporter permease [Synoicihabitans lomoniglobus]|uniref:ABC transporter permease n=1 Tax=Synoicihabitans lomoniglobus TaxID=2909285 RepID=A0AAE9ZXQ4_9BACT|nr:ABC transporter permease [Opitutaceae bacterium LMO-M01]WED65069.1 ABC transporter permease [Opitutaceae bacterium LMO-M01]
MSPFLNRLNARFRAVFRKPGLDADLDEELAHHLDLLTEENIGRGMGPTEARRRARIALGGVEQTRELHRETRGLPLLEQLGQDLRHTVRLLRRERGFTFIAILIIAVGVGLNTTVFSLVNTVLLRPLPFPGSERMLLIANGDPAATTEDLSAVAHLVDTWEALAENNQTLEALEVFDPFSLRQTYRLSSAGEPAETINTIIVSPGLFPMLGMTAHRGRLFTADDAVENGPPVVLLTHQLWQSRFHSDPGIVGQIVRINDVPVQVLGITPRQDAFASTFYPAVRIDCYFVLVNNQRRNWGNTLAPIGRMKPGVSVEQASADLAVAMALAREQRNLNEYHRANARSLHEHIAGGLKQPLLFLWVAAGLVLAIVAFNLGGLLLARGAARGKELALRAALGAGDGRILRQLFTESCVLVTIGSALGVALAAGFIHYLSVRSAIAIPLLQSVDFDGAALGFTLALCVATALLCGIAPAWRSSFGRGPGFAALKEEGRGSTTGRGLARTRSVLVVLEVALACGLAIAAGLVVRSLNNVLAIDLGYDPENLTAVRIDVLQYDETGPVVLDSIVDQVSALPGVTAVGFTDCLPVERDRSWGVAAVDNPEIDERREFTSAHLRVVSTGLMDAMSTRLVAGRDFRRTDGGDQAVIIINQTLARRFWPQGSAIDRFVSVNGQPYRVIGIAEDVHHRGPEVNPGNEMYLSTRSLGGSSWDLMIRSALPLNTLMASVRSAVHAIDPTLPLTQAREMTSLVDHANSPRRLMASLVAGFAAMALGLAALGLYGVISYTVAQRTKEIGIRMALGATASVVRREIVGRTVRLALAGIAGGLMAALATGRAMETLLYEVSSFDPGTYVVMTGAVLGCALLAGYLPARRASRVDPMVALRSD